ncbi:MAG TPA: GTPase Era [Bacteroidetes bacterium]|nr:GTPase Era [Bacteroidota bacterium]
MKNYCGYVCLFGKPNAGKSTILNSLLGFNLSIVNKKAQTTRNKILGILTENNHQAILTDVPGIIEPKYELQTYMVKEIKLALKDADFILYIIDSKEFNKDEFSSNLKLIEDKKYSVVLNKIDEIDNEKLIEIGNEINKLTKTDLIPLSAKTGFNIDNLKKIIFENLPESEFLYDEETTTDKPEKFFVSEIIRNNILTLFKEEIPYSVHIDIREFKEEKNKKDLINADIIVERESQKIIIIGKGGSMIKKIGQNSRKQIEDFLGREVVLKLFVKVKSDWRKDERYIKSLF